MPAASMTVGLFAYCMLLASTLASCDGGGSSPPSNPPSPNRQSNPPAYNSAERLDPMGIIKNPNLPVRPDNAPPDDYEMSAYDRNHQTNPPPGNPDVGGGRVRYQQPRPGDEYLTLAELRHRRDAAQIALNILMEPPQLGPETIAEARAELGYWDRLYRQKLAQESAGRDYRR